VRGVQAVAGFRAERIPLAFGVGCAYVWLVMETNTQATHPKDTHSQDPIERFTLRMEELRRDSVVRGPMRLLHNLFLDFFMSMFKLLAALAEQRRNGTLPDVAPAEVADQPRAWPPLRPRESGWAEYRSLYDRCGDSTMHAPAGQPEMSPEMPPETNEPVAPPPRVRARHGKQKPEPLPARRQVADEGGWADLARTGDGLDRGRHGFGVLFDDTGGRNGAVFENRFERAAGTAPISFRFSNVG